jgi:hypothetical protein
MVFIYRCWLIGYCPSVGSRYRWRLPPFCRSRILVAYVVPLLSAFRVVVVAANFFIPLALMLFSPRLSHLVIAVIFLLPYRFYFYLPPLLLPLTPPLVPTVSGWQRLSCSDFLQPLPAPVMFPINLIFRTRTLRP